MHPKKAADSVSEAAAFLLTFQSVTTRRWPYASSAPVSRRWLISASAGVKQPKPHGRPRSSLTNAANIWSSESENPNSKMPPVMTG